MIVAVLAPLGIAIGAWSTGDFGTGRVGERVLSVGTNALVCAVMLFTLVFAISRMRGRHAEATSAALELELLAQRDALTGLLNRRGVETHLADALAEAGRAEGAVPSTVTLIDIDHFKRINDEFGHPVGDEVLKAMAGHLQRILRPADAAARWGGEEFLLVSRGATVADTLDRIEHLQALIRAATWPAGIQVRASFGVAELQPGEAVDDALERADMALYGAKAGGRDRVEVAPAR